MPKHTLAQSPVTAWMKARDFFAGEEMVKSKKYAYLPELEDEKLYERYIQGAELLEVMPRTVSCYNGLVFRETPRWTLPSVIEYLANEFSDSKASLYDYAQQILHEALIVSYGLTLVDVSPEDPDRKPYAVFYKAEQIIEVRVGTRYSRQVVNYIKLLEIDDNDQKRYRVLELENGIYKVSLFDDKNNLIGVPVYPQQAGSPMDHIPAYFVSGNGLNRPFPERPILMSIVNLNNHHYRTSANYNISELYTAMPQIWMAGFPQPDNGIIDLGPGKVLHSPSPDAKAGFITGRDVASMEKHLDRLEKNMGLLGAGNLFDNGQAPQTATEAKLKNATQNSTLVNVTKGVSRHITCVLVEMAKFANVEPSTIKFELNTQFFPITSNPQELTVMLQALQAGKISLEAFLAYVEKAGLLPAGDTAEDEAKRIDKANAEAAQTPGGASQLNDPQRVS